MNYQVPGCHLLKQPPVSDPLDIVIERVELIAPKISRWGSLQFFIKSVGVGKRFLRDLEHMCKAAQCVLPNDMFWVRDKCLTVFLTHPHLQSLFFLVVESVATIVRFWPNPAVRPSIAGCQVENPAVAATGSCRLKADSAL
jgi:hypothetical protein